MTNSFIMHPVFIGGHYHQQKIPDAHTICSEKNNLTVDYTLGSQSYSETYELHEVRLNKPYRFYVSKVHSNECQKQLLLQAIQKNYPNQRQQIPLWLGSSNP